MIGLLLVGLIKKRETMFIGKEFQVNILLVTYILNIPKK